MAEFLGMKEAVSPSAEGRGKRAKLGRSQRLWLGRRAFGIALPLMFISCGMDAGGECKPRKPHMQVTGNPYT